MSADKSIKRDGLLSVRVPHALMELIEYIADQDGVTVADAVNKMLEEIVEIERVRRLGPEDAKLEWKALGAWFPHSAREQKATRRAQREARHAEEAMSKTLKSKRPKALSKLKIPQFDDRPESVALLAAIQAALPELEQLLDECDDHWGAEDHVYRFYYQSFKVYHLQDLTTKIAELLLTLSPDQRLHSWFEQIVVRGTGKVFKEEHNKRWLEETGPIVEAFFHARYFLEMLIVYGRELKRPPAMMPSGWAAILCLYNLR